MQIKLPSLNHKWQFGDFTILIFGFIIAILSVYGANPELKLYETRYKIVIIVSILTASFIINQRFKNPFVDILHVVYCVFYLLRIEVLLILPLKSDALELGLSAGTVSSSLLFLTLSFIALVTGCHLFLSKTCVETGILNIVETKVVKAILWCVTVIVVFNLAYYTVTFLDCNENPYINSQKPILAILHAIFDGWRALFFLLPILIIYSSSLSKSDRIVAYINIIILGMIGILIGQKSIVLQILLYLLFSLVVKYRSSGFLDLKEIWIKVILLLVLILPSYMLGKASRTIHLNHYCNSSVAGKVGALASYESIMEGRGEEKSSIREEQGEEKSSISIKRSSFDRNLLETMNGLSERTGYFDLFIERFTNPVYLDVVTFKRYYMAVIDKVTPGFDVYDVPFVSRSIYYAQHIGSVPGEMTNSEQITLFGEAWLLFGWGSLLYLPFMCFLFRLLNNFLNYYTKSSKLLKNIAFLFVLQLFYYWVEGMGLDMLIILHLLHTGLYTLFILALAWFIRVDKEINIKKPPSTANTQNH